MVKLFKGISKNVFFMGLVSLVEKERDAYMQGLIGFYKR